jgi:uncharacterized protein (DUF433 family)
MVTTRSGSPLIVRDPKIQGGEPTIRGTRVPVRSIVLAHRRYAGDCARVARAFTVDERAVTIALTFYNDHKAEIDRIIDENERAIARTDLLPDSPGS